jgi:hypothetical protein
MGGPRRAAGTADRLVRQPVSEMVLPSRRQVKPGQTAERPAPGDRGRPVRAAPGHAYGAAAIRRRIPVDGGTYPRATTIRST